MYYIINILYNIYSGYIYIYISIHVSAYYGTTLKILGRSFASLEGLQCTALNLSKAFYKAPRATPLIWSLSYNALL